MALCIICKAASPDPQKPEHILLNALGGREKTTKALCSRCNNALGSGADQDLADSVQFLRNIANLKSGTRSAPPMIRSISSEGRTFDLQPGGKPVIRPDKPLSINRGNGKTEIKIHARDEHHTRQLLEAAIRKFGINDGTQTEKIVSHIFAGGDFRRQFLPCPLIHQNFTFGYGKSKQSMAKACLVLWNELVENEEVCNSRYDLLRSFIRSDQDSSSSNYLSLYKPDFREVDDYDKNFESHPNIIWIGSNKLGRVLGYFRLYNIAGFRFELAQKGGLPDRSIYLVSNPFNNSIRKFQEGNFGQISFEWLEELDRGLEPDPENVTKSLQHFLSIAHEKIRNSFVKDVVHEACQQAGISEGERPTDNQTKILSEKIAIRLIPLITGDPFTVPLEDRWII